MCTRNYRQYSDHWPAWNPCSETSHPTVAWRCSVLTTELNVASFPTEAWRCSVLTTELNVASLPSEAWRCSVLTTELKVASLPTVAWRCSVLTELSHIWGWTAVLPCLGKLSFRVSVLQVSYGLCFWEGIQKHKREGRFLSILWPRTNEPEESTHLTPGFVFAQLTQTFAYLAVTSVFP